MCWCCFHLASLLQLLFKEDCTVDDLIDVIEGNRRYVKCLYVYNKVSAPPSRVLTCFVRLLPSIISLCPLYALLWLASFSKASLPAQSGSMPLEYWCLVIAS